jgi:hypothetical protein
MKFLTHKSKLRVFMSITLLTLVGFAIGVILQHSVSALQSSLTVSVAAYPDIDLPQWPEYRNSEFLFTLRYPPQSDIEQGSEDYNLRFDLPKASGTLLVEKLLIITAKKGDVSQCQDPTSEAFTAQGTVTYNGIRFLRFTGSGAGAGNFYESQTYIVSHRDFCVALTFVLHSTNPGMYYGVPDAPKPFDKAAESAVFGQILSTFRFNF